MGINKKLERWKKSELLSDQQVEAIIAFEKERGSKNLFRGLLWIGSFTIIIGVLSIIASNWQLIPASVKVIAHLLLNIGFASAVYLFERQGRDMLREFFLVGLWGGTLTLIALVGQVFQLDGSIASALFLWSVLVTPALAVYGRTRVSLVPWLASFLVGIGAGITEYIAPYLNKDQSITLLIGITAFLPMAFILFARFMNRMAEHSMLQKMLTFTGVTIIVIGANIACQLWYESFEFDDSLYYWMTSGMLLLAIASANFIQVQSNIKAKELTENIKMILVGSFAISTVPFLFMTVESSIMAAVTFIGYWLYLGFIFNRINLHSLVSFSMVMAAGRIYIIYLEVFGSMLQTGVGLIVSGLLLIGMVLGVHRLNKSISRSKI